MPPDEKPEPPDDPELDRRKPEPNEALSLLEYLRRVALLAS
jgi:hypothetical protein